MKLKKDDRGWVNLDDEKEKKPKTIKENVSFEENGEIFTPYAVSSSYRIPLWLKACFSKWWVAGMAYYFMFFGMQQFINQDLLVVIIGLVLGVAVDIFLNHFYRDSSSVGHNYKSYIFIGRKRNILTLPLNLAYYTFLSAIAAAIINIIVIAVKVRNPAFDSDNFLFSAGGLIFPTLVLGCDLLFTLLRNIVEKLYSNYREKHPKQNLIVDSSENQAQNSLDLSLSNNKQSETIIAEDNAESVVEKDNSNDKISNENNADNKIQ